MKDFELLKVLGTGAYGKVFLTRKRNGTDAGRLYAMKVLKKATIVQKRKTTEHTRTERQVLQTIRQSPFLVTLHYAFQSSSKLHLVLDYVNGGELFTHLYQREKFTENEVRIYIGEIILALEHLHKNKIIYRDIKLENILLDGEGHIVITDFGLSREFLPEEKEHRAYSFCGTIEYMAPEIVRGGNHGHDVAVDWWSLGVLTYELLTGASPFTVEGDKNTQQDISKRILNAEPLMPEFLSTEVKDFILKLLVKDPRKRLGGGPRDASEVRSHKFFSPIDWDDLLRKNIPAPFIPKIGSAMDVSNFSEEFTNMEVVDTPAAIPPNVENVFRGYSFVSPSILFTDSNVISNDMFRPNPDKKPSTSNLVGCILKKSPFFQRYDIDLSDKLLGDGSYSVCRRCVLRETRQEFAVKIISRRVDCSKEIELLKLCQGHPNIVKLIDVIQDDIHTYIVMEHLKGGELLERIRHKKRFDEAQVAKIMTKLMSAVNFMHFQGVVHRDLKPENILFTDDSDGAELKVVDFGFARLKPKEGQEGMKTPCFTLHYAAPEVLNQAVANKECHPDGYNESCDLWSLGVIMYVMLCGRSPFLTHRPKDDSAFVIMKRIKAGDFKIDAVAESSWKLVSSAGKQIVKGLLTVDPKKRLNLDDLFNSSWMRLSEQAGASARANQPRALHTPLVLQQQPLASERSLMMTYNAYHRVTREGGLAHLPATHPTTKIQPRRNKLPMGRNFVSSASSSGFSSLSSQSSLPSLSPTKTIANPWVFSSTQLAVVSEASEAERNTLSLRNSSRISDYLNNLAIIQQRQQQSADKLSRLSPSQACPLPPTPASPITTSLASCVPQPHSLISEALSGISYQVMPLNKSESSRVPMSLGKSLGVLQSQPSVSITPMPVAMSRALVSSASEASITTSPPHGCHILQQLLKAGPMTRSRKRKMKDDVEDEPLHPAPLNQLPRTTFPNPLSPNNNIPSVSITPIHEPILKKVYSLTATAQISGPLLASAQVTIPMLTAPIHPVTITLE
eukprot:maker-scaffold208_size258758-snap-gene-1.27 protein:Tk04202 transcript:maker-scaffold208_size258758-snap-gene-1.27-mRNA-1 annotation:"ribosomal protein s6 kinase alpha-"